MKIAKITVRNVYQLFSSTDFLAIQNVIFLLYHLKTSLNQLKNHCSGSYHCIKHNVRIRPMKIKFNLNFLYAPHVPLQVRWFDGKPKRWPLLHGGLVIRKSFFIEITTCINTKLHRSSFIISSEWNMRERFWFCSAAKKSIIELDKKL